MDYQKFTPFNFIKIIAILGAVVCVLIQGGMGFGYLAAMLLFGFALVISVVDILVQAFVEGSLKLILLIEFGIISCFVVFCLLKKY